MNVLTNDGREATNLLGQCCISVSQFLISLLEQTVLAEQCISSGAQCMNFVKSGRNEGQEMNDEEWKLHNKSLKPGIGELRLKSP